MFGIFILDEKYLLREKIVILMLNLEMLASYEFI